jgi:hypothetical protein
VPAEQVQEQFRLWFTQWGLPEVVRLDNGCPWGGWYDLPTTFELWLTGVPVKVHFNPARTPQDNGVIERFNGLGQRWAEVEKCLSAAELQDRLNEVDTIQREYMPSIQGKSRMQAYEAVKHSGRAYSQRWEEDNWSIEKAEEALEMRVAKRKVGTQGRISLYYRQVHVGQRLHGAEVQVQYDRGSKMWVISDAAGKAVRTVPAVEVNSGRIMTLTMYEEAKEKRRGAAK